MTKRHRKGERRDAAPASGEEARQYGLGQRPPRHESQSSYPHATASSEQEDQGTARAERWLWTSRGWTPASGHRCRPFLVRGTLMLVSVPWHHGVMEGTNHPRFRPTVWPGNLIPCPEITRTAARLRSGARSGNGVIQCYFNDDITLAELPDDFVLQEIFIVY